MGLVWRSLSLFFVVFFEFNEIFFGRGFLLIFFRSRSFRVGVEYGCFFRFFFWEGVEGMGS